MWQQVGSPLFYSSFARRRSKHQGGGIGTVRNDFESVVMQAIVD
jgi:hypothetical protein